MANLNKYIYLISQTKKNNNNNNNNNNNHNHIIYSYQGSIEPLDNNFGSYLAG